jgi:hypothetical protein
MDCVNFNNLPLIVDAMLTRAGVSNQVRTKVSAAAGELRQITGQVLNIEGSPTRRIIFVGGGTSIIGFEFPLNDAHFEAELTRAQTAGLIVGVLYWDLLSSPKTIVSIAVFAGEAISSRERY